MSDSSVASGSPPREAKRPASPVSGNEKRVSLACLRCRTKRARCSGDKPVCRACEKAKEECVWPTGRRRKRTRKEMEEEERRERLASAAADSLGYRDKRTPIRATDWRQGGQMSAEIYAEPMSWEYQTPVWPPAMNDSPGHSVVASSTPNVPPPPSFSDTRDRDYPRPRPIPYSDGDPTSLDDHYYYRYQSGSAAPAPPGLNRRPSLKLPGQQPTLRGTPLPRFNSLPSPPSPVHELEDMFDEIGLPYPHLYIPLLDTFFQTMSRHFPSISRQRIEERLESGTMSAFFLNCICALSARMAIRMAMDLGLHEVFEPYLSKAHVTRARLLFWSLFVTDRMLAFSSGRPPTIPEEIIEIPLPTDEDFVPDPARADAGDTEELPQPTPFVHMVRLMVLCGRITTVLAGCRGETRTLLPRTGEESLAKLKGLQEELVQFYSELLDAMKWSVDAFKHQEARGHGDSFLTLHLWANSVLAVSFHPELQEKPEDSWSPITQNIERSMKLSLSSSRIIAECLVFADLFASHSYLTSPFAVQPIYVASLAFINDMKSSPNTHSENKPMHTVDNLLSTLARQNLAVLTKAVQRMEHYWVGISSVSEILEQHAAGKVPFIPTRLFLGSFVDPLGALGVGLGFQRIDSSKKTRLSGVSLTDLALPDSSPIFTNSSNVNSRYDTREFYAHTSDAFDMGGMHLISDYNTDTASDGTTTSPHNLPAGSKPGRT
ncbi:hypothetical protein DXG01_009057 [Tephrocybe rancida]|nr:hypothetical protein DXG01_009057 [Tephrocybe rancida]